MAWMNLLDWVKPPADGKSHLSALEGNFGRLRTFLRKPVMRFVCAMAAELKNNKKNTITWIQGDTFIEKRRVSHTHLRSRGSSPPSPLWSWRFLEGSERTGARSPRCWSTAACWKSEEEEEEEGHSGRENARDIQGRRWRLFLACRDPYSRHSWSSLKYQPTSSVWPRGRRLSLWTLRPAVWVCSVSKSMKTFLWRRTHDR